MLFTLLRELPSLLQELVRAEIEQLKREMARKIKNVGLGTLLVVVALSLGRLQKRVRVPYTVALVIVGAVVGGFGILPDLHLTPEVVFGILLEMIRGGEVGLRAGLTTFAVVVVGGAAVGLALGLIFSRLTALVDDHLIEITLTTILAFAAYLGAEAVHCSGVISVVMAGLMVGNYGTRTGMSPTTRVSVGDFWEYAAFVVNSVIFLLIGLEVMAGTFADFLGGVAAAVLATFLGRAVGVAASAAVINLFAEPLSPRWQGAMVWGGLRGSLSMALALTLPAGFPARQSLLTLVFGVVAFSLVVQGLTMKPLLRRLGLGEEGAGQRDFEERRGRLLALTAAGEEIFNLERRGVFSHGTASTLGREFADRVLAARAAVTEGYEADASIRERELARARGHLLNAGKEAVKSAGRNGIITEETLKTLLDEMDREREKGLGTHHPPQAEA